MFLFSYDFMSARNLCFLIFFFCCAVEAGAQPKLPDVTDTVFLKKIKYEKLNKYISYYVVNKGKYSANPKLAYRVKMFAIYYYQSHKYKTFNDSKEGYMKGNVVAGIIKSGQFADRDGFVGIFRINSKMEFIWRPVMLKRISVIPKKSDLKSVNGLMVKLRKERFVSSLSLDTLKNDLLVKLMSEVSKRVYVKIKLKDKYCSLDNLEKIGAQLERWPEVSSAAYGQLFTGANEQENFFEIKSGIDILPKKEVVTKSKDPFKDFVDSLKKH